MNNFHFNLIKATNVNIVFSNYVDIESNMRVLDVQSCINN
jgi:hypothetical protein